MIKLTLESVLDDLSKLDGSDPEAEHGKADDALIETIVFLSNTIGDKEIDRKVQAILSAFNKLEKWYA